jgi:hypothetical protein
MIVVALVVMLCGSFAAERIIFRKMFIAATVVKCLKSNYKNWFQFLLQERFFFLMNLMNDVTILEITARSRKTLA